MPTSLLFVGGCNRQRLFAAHANARGIAAFRVDEETGASELLGITEGIDNPTFLATSADGRLLCATSEVGGWNEGTITAYAIDRASGALTYLNKQPTRGDSAAHLSFSPDRRHVGVANYSTLPMTARPNKSVATYRIAADGELSPLTAEVAHTGHGPNAGRQERPHPHCVRWTPDGRFVLVADLGIDKVISYAFDAAAGTLAPQGEVALPPGSGPRHIAFHPSLPFVYVVNELSSTVASFAFDAAAGRLELLGTALAVPEAQVGKSWCSAIKIAPDGRYLFVGNRGEDTIAGFAIDPKSGVVTLASTTPSGGEIPRDFDFSPGGRLLAVANQNSNRVDLFAYDPASGALTPKAVIETGTPTAIGWVKL